MLCVRDEAALGSATGTRKMEKFAGRSATLRTKDPEKRARSQPLSTDVACCCKHFVEEGLGLGGYLLGVEFASEDRWFVGDPVAVDRQC